jgi:hypothetical protein
LLFEDLLFGLGNLILLLGDIFLAETGLTSCPGKFA